MKQYLLANAESNVPLNVAAGALDLERWFFGMSDVDYQQCSRVHFGAGLSKLPDGRRTSVNVERVGGHFAVQHYVEELSRPDHLKLVSEKSDIWIYRLIHIHPTVTWEIKLVPQSHQSCIFHHRVSIEHPSILVKIASVICFVPFFVRMHDREEAKLFAAKLVQVCKSDRA